MSFVTIRLFGSKSSRMEVLLEHIYASRSSSEEQEAYSKSSYQITNLTSGSESGFRLCPFECSDVSSHET